MRCKSDDCWGAHDVKDYKIHNEILNFRKRDLYKLDYLDLYLTIRKSILDNITILNKLTTIKSSLIMELNFIDMLNIWIKLASMCRKYRKRFYTIKELKSKGFKYPQEIPDLDLGEKEDLVWGFNRSFNVCKLNELFWSEFKSGSNKLILLKNMCNYSHNCKSGTHLREYQICYDDMCNGTCDCLSKDENIEKLKSIDNDIQKLKVELKKYIKYKCPIINNAKGNIKTILVKLREKIYEKEKNMRKIHLTDDVNYVGFNILFERYKNDMLKKREDEKKIQEEKIRKLTEKPVIRKTPKFRVGFRK
jgi:hypothetical protein